MPTHAFGATFPMKFHSSAFLFGSSCLFVFFPCWSGNDRCSLQIAFIKLISNSVQSFNFPFFFPDGSGFSGKSYSTPRLGGANGLQELALPRVTLSQIVPTTARWVERFINQRWLACHGQSVSGWYQEVGICRVAPSLLFFLSFFLCRDILPKRRNCMPGRCRCCILFQL